MKRLFARRDGKKKANSSENVYGNDPTFMVQPISEHMEKADMQDQLIKRIKRENWPFRMEWRFSFEKHTLARKHSKCGRMEFLSFWLAGTCIQRGWPNIIIPKSLRKMNKACLKT